jgi:hypothetical protein
VQSVKDTDELEEEARLISVPEETSRMLAPGKNAPGRSLDAIIKWAETSFGGDVGL